MPDRRDVDFVPVADVLARDVSWSHAHEMQVLGIPVVCRSNSRDVCDRFAEAFSVCRNEGIDDGAQTLTVRVAIVPWTARAEALSPVCAFAVQGARLLLHSSDSVAMVDPERRDAVAFVSAAFAADTAFFTRQLLETMTFALLTHHDRHPMHAAAIVRSGRALLLTGPSGAGKSTLAHVAHAAGLTVLSEDTVWIQQQPELRVWGLPRAVYLRDGAAPEKLAVPLNGPAAAPACSASAVDVCILAPGHASAQLERMDPDVLAQVLSRDVAPGFDRYAERHAAVVRELAKSGGWRLRLTSDPAAALPLLEQMLCAER